MSATMSEVNFKADPTVVSLAPVKKSLAEFRAGLVIRDDASFHKAAERLKTIKGALASIEDARVRITKPINESLRETNAQAKAAAAPFLEDESAIKRAMVAYSDEQDRKREEQQRRDNEAAAKERARLQAIADETARKAKEQADEKRRQAEEAAAAGRAEESAKLAAQASRIETRGADKQEAFQDRASQVVAPLAAQAAPKVAGIAIPKIWRFRVENKAALPEDYKLADEVKIGKMVKASGGSIVIQGVVIWPDKTVAAGKA